MWVEESTPFGIPSLNRGRVTTKLKTLIMMRNSKVCSLRRKFPKPTPFFFSMFLLSMGELPHSLFCYVADHFNSAGYAPFRIFHNNDFFILATFSCVFYWFSHHLWVYTPLLRVNHSFILSFMGSLANCITNIRVGSLVPVITYVILLNYKVKKLFFEQYFFLTCQWNPH